MWNPGIQDKTTPEPGTPDVEANLSAEELRYTQMTQVRAVLPSMSLQLSLRNSSKILAVYPDRSESAAVEDDSATDATDAL